MRHPTLLLWFALLGLTSLFPYGSKANTLPKKHILSSMGSSDAYYLSENILADTINKIVYKKKTYSKTRNLISNSDFSANLSSWTTDNLGFPAQAPIINIERISEKNWVRLDCSNKTTSSSQGYIEQVVSIPEKLRNSILEFSFDVFGRFSKINVQNLNAGTYNIVIPANKPERIYIYLNPQGQANVSIKLFRSATGQEIPGQSVYFSNIQLTPAQYTYRASPNNLPENGLNLQLARWLANWNVDFQEKYLKKISNDISPFIRVWLSSELFATYIQKSDPVRRPIDNIYLSDNYKNLSTCKIPTGFNNNIDRLDWFFQKCSDLGIKLHVTLGSGFTDGKGNPHSNMNVNGLYEFLDSDTTVQHALTRYFVNIVSRYKNYKNIIGYELINEGYPTWTSGYAGYALTTPYSTVRCFSYGGYKNWERETYTAIKKVDKDRPIILDLGLDVSNLQFLATDDICDWFCPSYYGGKLTINTKNISNNTLVSNNNLGSIQNGYQVVAYNDNSRNLPEGIQAGKSYYVINLNKMSFQLSNTPGGEPVPISGGQGLFYFYSLDGGLIDADSQILESLKYNSKFVYFSEFGAPVIGNNLLYRDENVNSLYISKILSLLKKYKIGSVIFYDESNLFFDNNFTNKKNTLRIMLNKKQ